MLTLDGAESLAEKFNKKQVWTSHGKWVAKEVNDKPSVYFISENIIPDNLKYRLSDIAFGYLTALGY